MFIEFTTKDNKTVLLSTAQIVAVESDTIPVTLGIQGGGNTLRIHATEGRVYQLDAKRITLQSLKEQIAAITEIVQLKNG